MTHTAQWFMRHIPHKPLCPNNENALLIQFLQCLQQRIDMPFGTHVVAGDNHGTVRIDDERRTNHAYMHLAVELLFAVCAVQLVHGQVGIRQQRECEMIALCKLA